MPTKPVSAPAAEWLTARQAAKHLGISAPTLYRLLEAGKFPPGTVFGRNNRRWHWLTIVAYGEMVREMPGLFALPPEDGPESGKKK